MRPNGQALWNHLWGFIPSIVTILGVIMYLRQGGLLATPGFLGASLIFDNVRHNSPDALRYPFPLLQPTPGCTRVVHMPLSPGHLVSKLAQPWVCSIRRRVLAIVISMYIFGFREGWLALFPTHNPVFIDICSFTGIFGVTLFSTQLAFRLQYAVFAITLFSILSVSHRPFQYPIDNWIGNFQSLGGGYSGFWGAFAVSSRHALAYLPERICLVSYKTREPIFPEERSLQCCSQPVFIYG